MLVASIQNTRLSATDPSKGLDFWCYRSSRVSSGLVVRVLELFCLIKTPARVVIARFCPAFGARLRNDFDCTLQASRFFEAPMPSLLHESLPPWNRPGEKKCCSLGMSHARVLGGRAYRRTGRDGRSAARISVLGVADTFDTDAMIERFKARAAAVRRRGLPPVEGPERQMIMEQMQLDYMDFAILADASATLEDGVLTLRIDLRPPGEESPASGRA
jgi:hypothetical protein